MPIAALTLQLPQYKIYTFDQEEDKETMTLWTTFKAILLSSVLRREILIVYVAW